MERFSTVIKSPEDTIKVQAQLVAILPQIGKGKAFDCEIKLHRKKRSLDANAYFHVLVEKISQVMGIGNDECKVRMNLEYGTMRRLSDGTIFAIQVPTGADVKSAVDYPKFYGQITDNGVLKDKYILYKPTSTLDTKEMARLIDGVVQEAKQLGIETMTPAELARMKSMWNQRQK